MIFNRLALGTANWGQEYNGARVSEDEQKRILDYCQEIGIDMIDTATAYGWDWTKIDPYFKVIVKAQTRTDIKLALNTEPYAILGHNIKAYEYLFEPEIIYALGRTKKHVKRGASVYEPTHNMYAGSILQIPYSIYDRRWESYIREIGENETYEIYVRSVFLRGKLLEKFKPWECIAFCLMNPYIDRVIIGVDSLAQLRENLEPFRRMDAAQVHDERVLDTRKWPK